MNKKYVREDGFYFSGQGYVCLETEEEIYELGNCTDLVFHNDGTFGLVWEKFYSRNIELLLGKSSGEESFTPITGKKEIKFNKFSINKDFKRDFILHFSGVNTANSDDPIVLKASIEIGMAEFIPLINDELASFLTNGKWYGDLELFLPVEKRDFGQLLPTQNENNRYPRTPSPYRLAGGDGETVKVLAYTGNEDRYDVISAFNSKHVVCLKDMTVEGGLNSTKIVLTNDSLIVDMHIQDVANYLDRLSRNLHINKKTHTEKSTGMRLVDYIYTPHTNNKIRLGVK
jgi:hypothetical protein